MYTNAHQSHHDDIIFTSDYKMVITTLDLSAMHKIKIGVNRSVKGEAKTNIMNNNTTSLVRDEEARKQYQTHLKELIDKDKHRQQRHYKKNIKY